jgi:hypothetical protein
MYSFIVNTFYDGILRDFRVSDNELIGKLWGFIELLIRDEQALLRMSGDVMLSFESFEPNVVSETWLFDIHFLGFNLTNWLIIDIGAFVGDTALYYAKRGVFVIAAEPLPK